MRALKRRRLLMRSALSVLLVIALGTPAAARTLWVDAAAPADGVSHFALLSDALDVANADSSPDTINIKVKPGTYANERLPMRITRTKVNLVAMSRPITANGLLTGFESAVTIF